MDNYNALIIRRKYMNMMGLSKEEIEEYCSVGNNADIDKELAQYWAMTDIVQLSEGTK